MIPGEAGSGVIGLNGAAALLGNPGDRVIGMTFCLLTPAEVAEHHPRVVLVGEGNRPTSLVPG